MKHDDRPHTVDVAPTRFRVDGSLLREPYVSFRGDGSYRTRFDDPGELRRVANEMLEAADDLEEQLGLLTERGDA